MRKTYTIDDAAWYEYLMREKAYRDQISFENRAKREKEEALQKGLAEGREEGLTEGAQKNL